MYNEIDFNKSVIISIIIHLLIFLILTLILQKNPFELETKPLVVTIQSESESISSGLDKKIEEARKKTVPVLKERVTKSLERVPVQEKLEPKKEIAKTVVPPHDIVKKTVKETSPTDTEKILKKEVIKEEIKETPIAPKEEKNIRKLLEEVLEKKKEKIVDENVKKVDDTKTKNIPDKEIVSPKADTVNNEDSKKMVDDIDKLLEEEARKIDEGLDTVGKSDPLSDAAWSSKPRKTLFFPNISDKIPEKYRKKGVGYSITARLVFDKNGLVVKVDIVTSSGEIEIDNIFSKELKKIRVEPIKENRFDEITKEFIISVK